MERHFEILKFDVRVYWWPVSYNTNSAFNSWHCEPK